MGAAAKLFEIATEKEADYSTAKEELANAVNQPEQQEKMPVWSIDNGFRDYGSPTR